MDKKISINKKNNRNFCPLAKKCGACQIQNMTYEEQLSWKMAKTIKLLGRFGHVDEIIGMENPFYYRNKVQAAFGTTKSGKIISGIYKSGTHQIVASDSCFLENQTADKIVVTVRELLKSFKLTAYNENTHKGFLRHILIRTGRYSGEVLVTLVTGTPVFPGKNNFVKALTEMHPEITTIVQNINNSSTSMILGEKQQILYGKGYIEDTLCGCKFRISAKSFFQINPIQTEKLYNTAIKFAELSPEDTVIDAYCGVGTIGLIASAKSGCKVIGTELNSDAVKDALINKKINNIDSAAFVNEDATEFMKNLASDSVPINVLFMDPPRSGSTKEFLDAAISLSPEKIVYISCNPETQARDLQVLIKNRYKVKKIQPVDMFPHTAHIETVVQLVRKN